MSQKHCILIFHGSSSMASKTVADSISQKLLERLPYKASICYLREGYPSFPEALEEAYCQGARSITCLPLLLLPGSHTLGEVPSAILNFAKWHSDCRVKQLPCLAENQNFIDFVISILDENNG